MRIIIIVSLLFASWANADIHIVHCPLGCPANPVGNDLVVKYTHALSNDPATKFADWVAYEVNVRNFGDSPGRNWKADPMLEDEETLEPSDYAGASNAINIDRGHQAPLASFAGSHYWSELNHLSNITPQRKALNQGPWMRLEQAVRDGVGFRNSLYVLTGPLYESDESEMPNSEEHVVPSGYWKIVYDGGGNATGFIMDQELGRNADYCAQAVPLQIISQRSGLTMPDLVPSGSMRRRLSCP